MQKTSPTKSVVLLSGGMDSTVALAQAVSKGEVVGALSVDYGQRHRKEVQAARDVAAHYQVPHFVLDLRSWGRLLVGSALTDSNVSVPDGHYAEPTMEVTVVPNRNATMLMAAVGVAQSLGAGVVITAVHAGDHAVYPDCRPEFIEAASNAAELGTGGEVRIVAPFVTITKTDICALGEKLRAPLPMTWSCYQGGKVHCGRCGTCYERREAFTDARVPDYTRYESTPPLDRSPEGAQV